MLCNNPNAIYLLEQNLDKIDWDILSLNPNAINILEQNLDKIHWGALSEIQMLYTSWNKMKIKYIGIIYHQIQMPCGY